MKYIRKFNNIADAANASNSLTTSLFYVDDLSVKNKKCLFSKLSLENENIKPTITVYLNNGDWNVSTDIRPQTNFGYEIFKSTTTRNIKDIKEICIVTENLTMIDFYIATKLGAENVLDNELDCFVVCTLNDGLKNANTENIISDCNNNFMNNKSRFYNIIGHNIDASFKLSFDNINNYKYITYNLYKNRNIIYISHFPTYNHISSVESCLIIPTSNYYDINVVNGVFVEDEYSPTEITNGATNNPTDPWTDNNQTSGPSSQPSTGTGTPDPEGNTTAPASGTTTNPTTTTYPASGTTTPEP